MNEDAVLAAGTIVEFSLDLTTPVYTIVDGIDSVGAVGLMSEAKEKTTLADADQKKYGASLQDAPDKTMKGKYYSGSVEQSAFVDACKARTPMLVKVTYPDKPNLTGTGTVATFDFQPLGFELDDVTGEDWMMFTVNGKQNSITWTDPVAGV